LVPPPPEQRLQFLSERLHLYLTDEEKQKRRLMTGVLDPDANVLALGVEELVLKKHGFADDPPVAHHESGSGGGQWPGGAPKGQQQVCG
jgi:hypothetical protein